MKFQWIEKKLSAVKEVDLREVSGKDSYHKRQFFKRLGRGLEKDCQIDMDAYFTAAEQENLARLLIEAMMQGGYFFGRQALKECKEQGIYALRDALAGYPKHTVYLAGASSLDTVLKDAQRLGKCIGYARMLGDIPGNYLHVQEFAAYAKAVSSHLPVKIDIYGDKELEEMNCGGILAVNQASDHEANLLVLTYEGSPTEPCTALVGKGILFDSGGYHLKSLGGMEGMKYDMCGAADVLSLLEYLAVGAKKINVTAVIPMAENVISPDGVKMGDVLTTMSGKTVEVYNTDAEGRLLLCDALTFACRKVKAQTVLDFATLTYSCKNALGDEFVGVFCNDEDLYEKVADSAKTTGEKIWRLPLDEIYHHKLKWSKTADIANYAPGKGGGASVAACFLEEFMEPGTAWAHFDMVGPAVQAKDTPESQSGATGNPISTAAAYLLAEENR